MAKLTYPKEYNPDMEEWNKDTNDFYENWNKAHRQFLGNDAALKEQIEENGITVVNGMLCITYDKEE